MLFIGELKLLRDVVDPVGVVVVKHGVPLDAVKCGADVEEDDDDVEIACDGVCLDEPSEDVGLRD